MSLILNLLLVVVALMVVPMIVVVTECGVGEMVANYICLRRAQFKMECVFWVLQSKRISKLALETPKQFDSAGEIQIWMDVCF